MEKKIKYLAIILDDIVSEFASVTYFQIIPRLQSDGFSVMLSPIMVMRDRVWAVVGHVLASLGRKHLQESNLVRICFVSESKSAIIGNVRKPSFTFLRFVCDFTRDGRFGCDTRGHGFHVTINQYGIFRSAWIGIDPVLKINKKMMFV